jgi:predicted TIM-barrel fold metal-dependent hydrolase
LGIGPFAGKRQEVYADWRRSIGELAQAPNVFMKLGGLGMRLTGINMHLRKEPPSSEELAELWAPYANACIEAFGAQRCMFESNFPVDKATVSYGVLWNAYKRLTAACSADEKDWLFSRTASTAYRIC